MLPAIFTLDVGGKAVLVFEAKNLRESWELCHEQWLREDLARQKSGGVALWDGKAPLRTRYATADEKQAYFETNAEGSPDELVLAYLVKLDP